MPDKIKLLLVGIGGYGAGYVMTALNMEDEFEVVGVADPFAQNAASLDELEDIPVFDTIEEFFAAGHTADAAVISSPIQLHCEQLEAALNHSLHVLCEKPLCADGSQAQRMLTAAAAQPAQKVLIGFQWSFSPAMLAFKRQILDGVWGKPVSIKAIVRWPRAFNYYKRNDWAGRLRDSAGNFVGDSVLSNATAHYLHNPLFMLGSAMDTAAEPSQIEAQCFKAFDIETFDTAFVKLAVPDRFGSETDVFIAVSHCTEETAEPYVEYTFEHGIVRCAGDDRLKGTLRGEEVDFGVIGGGLEGYYNKMLSLYRCANALEKPPCTVATALPELTVANTVLSAFPAAAFDPARVEECTAPLKEARLKVNGLDAVMLECYQKSQLPSQLALQL